MTVTTPPSLAELRERIARLKAENAAKRERIEQTRRPRPASAPPLDQMVRPAAAPPPAAQEPAPAPKAPAAAKPAAPRAARAKALEPTPPAALDHPAVATGLVYHCETCGHRFEPRDQAEGEPVRCPNNCPGRQQGIPAGEAVFTVSKVKPGKRGTRKDEPAPAPAPAPATMSKDEIAQLENHMRDLFPNELDSASFYWTADGEASIVSPEDEELGTVGFLADGTRVLNWPDGGQWRIDIPEAEADDQAGRVEQALADDELRAGMRAHPAAPSAVQAGAAAVSPAESTPPPAEAAPAAPDVAEPASLSDLAELTQAPDVIYAANVPDQAAYLELVEFYQATETEYRNRGEKDDAALTRLREYGHAFWKDGYTPDDQQFREDVGTALKNLGVRRCGECGRFVGADDAANHGPHCQIGQAAREARYPRPVIKPLKDGLTFHTDDPADWGENAGPKTRFKNNVAALKLAAQLKAEGRQATADEQAVLAKFVSWGGIPQPFDQAHEVMTVEELEAKFAENNDQFDGSYNTPYWSAVFRYLPLGQRRAAEEWLSKQRWQSWDKPRQAQIDQFKEWLGAQKTEWSDEARELRRLLPKEEYEQAARTITNAHYTSKQVVDAMWGTVRHLGFTGGTVLEPAVGKGAFIMGMPEDLARQSAVTGVDRDTGSVDIARQLCQQADIRLNGYQETALPKNHYDLVISNVPFGKIPVYDREFAANGTNRLLTGQLYECEKCGHEFEPRPEKAGQPAYCPECRTKVPDTTDLPSVHNYYFAKALSQVKPGGLIAFITSRYTLDAKSAEGLRAYLASEADLVGATRLPNTAFKGNAGTEVTTDVIYLRKRLPGEQPGDTAWVKTQEYTGADGVQFQLNNYFAAHPEMMLGRMEGGTGKMHRSSSQPQLAGDGRDLGEAMRAAGQTLQAGVLKQSHPAYNCPACGNFIGEDGLGHKDECSMISGVFQTPALAVNAYAGEMKLGDDGQVYVLGQAGQWEPHPLTAKKRKDGSDQMELQRVRAYLGVKSAMIDVLDANRTNAADDVLEAAQGRLNAAYDAFVGRFGPLNDPSNARALRHEPYKARIMALEVYDAETNFTAKEPIFFRRLNTPAKYADHADTPEEALTITQSELGEMNFARMAQLMPGRTAESLQAELNEKGLIYKDEAGEWVTSDVYLSGNVRKKLAAARALAEQDPAYQINVAALEKVQPRDLEPSEIDIAPGQSWIPKEDLAAFMASMLKARNVNVTYNPVTAAWAVGADFAKWGVENTQLYGTNRMDAATIYEHLLNGTEIKVWDKDDNDNRVLNQEATLAAQQKAEEMKKLFQAWMLGEKADEARKTRLTALYNERENAEVAREYRHPNLTLPGMSMEIPPLYESQKNAIWRIMQGDNVGLFHSVGFGKSFTAIAGGMELKRTGKRKKIMHCVPNNMLKQYTADIYRMYPNARVLSISSKMIEDAPGASTADKRNYVMARIAQGEWDAVVVTHSAFGKIPLSADSETSLIQERIDEYKAALEAAKADGDKMSAKEIQSAMEKYQVKLQQRMDKLNERKDSHITTWEDLGVDQVFVDEADLFKNLPFATRKNIPGVKGRASQRADDMFNKLRVMQLRCPKCGKFMGSDTSRCQHCLTPKPKAPVGAAVFMTGTPIANSVSELYIMQRYLDYDGLKRDGKLHFDAWAAQYGDEVTALEMKPSGKGYRMFTRFARYKNLPELKRKLWRFADIQQDAEVVGVQRPHLIGGKQQTLAAASTKGLQAFIDELADRSEHLSAKTADQDNMLKITGDGRAAAVDLRLRQGAMEQLLARMEEQSEAGVWQEAIDRAERDVEWRTRELQAAGRDSAADAQSLKDAQANFKRAKAALAEARRAKPRKEAQLEDLRRLKALGWDDPQSKVNLALREIATTVDATTGVLVPNLRGDLDFEGPQNLATVVFLDSGTPKGYQTKGKAAEKIKRAKAEGQDVLGVDFNLYQDLKDKLVAGVAVPQPDGTVKTIKLNAEEIAFAHDYDTDDKKMELTNAVNAGKIRVVIGSTSKLGAGTNMQKRLGLEIHIDAPWRPRDVEQREGRIARAGNHSWLPDPSGRNTRRCTVCGNFIAADGSGHKKKPAPCTGIELGDSVLETAPWAADVAEYDKLPGREKAARQRAWFDQVAAPARQAWEAWRPVGDELKEKRQAAESLRTTDRTPAQDKELAALDQQITALTEREAPLLAALQAEQQKRAMVFTKWAKPQPKIVRCVTEESFDVYNWQMLETKGRFIAQGLDKDLTKRRLDEVDGGALNASEVKALATGDPRLIERTGLTHELENLERTAGAFYDAQHRARKEMEKLPDQIEAARREAENMAQAGAAVTQARTREAQELAGLQAQLSELKEQAQAARSALTAAKEAAEKARKEARKAAGAKGDDPDPDTPELAAAKAAQAAAQVRADAAKTQADAMRTQVEDEGGYKIVLGSRAFHGRKKASQGLIELESRVAGEPHSGWLDVGEYLGFPVVARHRGMGAVQVSLKIGDQMVTVADGGAFGNRNQGRAFDALDEGGYNADYFRKALESVQTSVGVYQRRLADLEGRAAPLQAVLARKFEKQAELEQKRARLKELQAEFDAEDAACAQVIDAEVSADTDDSEAEETD